MWSNNELFLIRFATGSSDLSVPGVRTRAWDIHESKERFSAYKIAAMSCTCLMRQGVLALRLIVSILPGVPLRSAQNPVPETLEPKTDN